MRILSRFLRNTAAFTLSGDHNVLTNSLLRPAPGEPSVTLTAREALSALLAISAAPADPRMGEAMNTIYDKLPPERRVEYDMAVRDYCKKVEEKYRTGLMPELMKKAEALVKAARPTPVPHIVGRQVNDNEVAYVKAVRTDGGFNYTPDANLAHRFPSRSQAYLAVRRRMQAARVLAKSWPASQQDQIIGKYTDFFAMPATSITHRDRNFTPKPAPVSPIGWRIRVTARDGRVFYVKRADGIVGFTYAEKPEDATTFLTHPEAADALRARNLRHHGTTGVYPGSAFAIVSAADNRTPPPPATRVITCGVPGCPICPVGVGS